MFSGHQTELPPLAFGGLTAVTPRWLPVFVRPSSTRRRVTGRDALRDGWTAARSFALETVYPRRCAGCGRRGTWVCTDCRRNLPSFAPPWCDGCGVPPALGPCRCDSLPSGIAGVRSVGPFRGWLHGAIVGFKYHDEWARADHLGEELATVVAQIGIADALIPVPLHPSRERRRGYNQAALLAGRAAKLTGTPKVDALTRIRATPRQVGSGALERHQNVEDAFALRPSAAPVTGLKLIIIDDVLTTGATVGACAAALRAGGAAEIWVATLAREM